MTVGKPVMALAENKTLEVSGSQIFEALSPWQTEQYYSNFKYLTVGRYSESKTSLKPAPVSR